MSVGILVAPVAAVPVALTLGSDVLSHFIATVDVSARRLILGVPK